MLLALVSEGGGVAARVLENLGVDPNNIRKKVEVIYLLSIPISIHAWLVSNFVRLNGDIGHTSDG